MTHDNKQAHKYMYATTQLCSIIGFYKHRPLAYE